MHTCSLKASSERLSARGTVARKPIDPLGHETRTEILMLLEELEAAPDEMRGYLPGAPDLATVSYHLRILERAELVERIGGVYRRVDV